MIIKGKFSDQKCVFYAKNKLNYVINCPILSNFINNSLIIDIKEVLLLHNFQKKEKIGCQRESWETL